MFGETKWNLDKIKQQLQLLSYLTVGVKFILKFDSQTIEFLSTEVLKT